MPSVTARISNSQHVPSRHALRRIISAFVTLRASTVCGRLFHATRKFCENELKACGFSDICTGTFLVLKSPANCKLISVLAQVQP